MHPTWKEENVSLDDVFISCVQLAKKILAREIIQARDTIEAEDAVISAYENAKDKRIIVLEKNYPFEYLLSKYPEPLFAIYPRRTRNEWGVKAIKLEANSFKNRKDLPVSWGGLSSGELQKISGVPDAVFCHRALFLAGAQSREGAIKLAQIALES